MKSNTGTVCYPFPYSAVDGCLYMEKANKNGTATRKLCNFLPYLKCDINVDDGVEQTRTFRIAGIHESGRLLPEIEVTVKEFGKMDWVLERWGAECIIEPGNSNRENICCAILKTVENAEKKNVYRTTGWHLIDGKWEYLLPNDGKHDVRLFGKLRHYEMANHWSDSDLKTVWSMMKDRLIATKAIIWTLIFNEEGIKSPAYYQKQLLGKNLGYNKPKIGLKYLWDNTGVKRILQNEFYIGTLTCHKTYNNKITHIRKDVPKEEQYVHENFVTPIISKEKFELVQKMIEQKKKGNVRASAGQPCHRYSGLLECGDCGSTFTSVKRTWNGVERIEYVCNGYHRYGKENCPPHRIRETELDEIICGEITNVKEQAAQLYENIDGEVRKWLKKKSTVTGKIRQLNAELEQKKSDQKEILLERIRDKEHASVYDEMLSTCESDIKKIEQELYDIQHYSETIKKRKSEMKKTVELIDKIIIYESSNGLRIQVNLRAAFTEHMIILDEFGKQNADLKVEGKYNYPFAMRRRMRVKE